MSNKLVDKFLSLKCSSDVLEAVRPLNSPSKEISETMILINAIRSYTLSQKMVYSVTDLCAGSALTAITAVHMLPITEAIAIDLYPQRRPGHANVRRFEYRTGNIYDESLWQEMNLNRSIVVASHACKDLALQIARKCRQWDLPLAMLTCCQSQGQMSPFFKDLALTMGKYEAWTAYVANVTEGRFKFIDDCLSPANGLVTRKL